ncbi:MAG: hypothetical protein PHH93_08840, partial [Prolixibacteraceae bacterium]|nr:hypothetical protein [Prolixibacteraceae bacterium]
MKSVFRITLLIAALTWTSFALQAQRIIKGTVYREGEPAAGVTVEAHRGGTMMTSFDGKYEVQAHENTKWIKFIFINESEKLDLSDKTGDVFDFAFDGKMPAEGQVEEVGGDVILKSSDELIRDQDRDYMNELSLYIEFYKQENYKSALPHWNTIYNKYPKSTPNVYIHGANMYESFIENAETPEERSKQIDALMKLYDKRIKYFGEKGYVMGRKATAWLNYKLNTDNPPEGDALKEVLNKGYEWLSISLTEQGEKTELPVFVLLMQTTRSLFLLGELPKETVVTNYDLCNNNLEQLLANCDDQEISKTATDVKNNIEDIFGASGAADCEALINIFTPQFEEKSTDIEFIKGMLRRL